MAQLGQPATLQPRHSLQPRPGPRAVDVGQPDEDLRSADRAAERRQQQAQEARDRQQQRIERGYREEQQELGGQGREDEYDDEEAEEELLPEGTDPEPDTSDGSELDPTNSVDPTSSQQQAIEDSYAYEQEELADQGNDGSDDDELDEAFDSIEGEADGSDGSELEAVPDLPSTSAPQSPGVEPPADPSQGPTVDLEAKRQRPQLIITTPAATADPVLGDFALPVPTVQPPTPTPKPTRLRPPPPPPQRPRRPWLPPVPNLDGDPLEYLEERDESEEATYPRELRHEEEVLFRFNPATGNVQGERISATKPTISRYDRTRPEPRGRHVGGWYVTPDGEDVLSEATERQVAIPDSVRVRLRKQSEETGGPVEARHTLHHWHDVDLGAHLWGVDEPPDPDQPTQHELGRKALAAKEQSEQTALRKRNADLAERVLKAWERQQRQQRPDTGSGLRRRANRRNKDLRKAPTRLPGVIVKRG